MDILFTLPEFFKIPSRDIVISLQGIITPGSAIANTHGGGYLSLQTFRNTPVRYL
jgi:hypothetical protein